MDSERKKILMVVYSIITAIALVITSFVLILCLKDKDYKGMIEMVCIFIACEVILVGPEFMNKDGIFKFKKVRRK